MEEHPEEGSNPEEIDGIKSLQKRIQKGEIIVAETDKSGKLCVLEPSLYHNQG